jgi:uncharacterized RDD family membrane protein YckC
MCLMTEVLPSDTVPPLAATPAAAPLPFWRRLIAFAVDGVILGLGCGSLGLMALPLMEYVGPWGRAVGAAIGVAYFGFCGSHLTGGRTLGKRLMNIAVVRRDGTNLPLPAAFARATLLILPMLFNGWDVSDSMVFEILATIAVFGLGAAIVYLFFFNRRTRQGLHDLAVNSVVVRAEPAQLVDATVWRPHFIVLAVLFALGAGGIWLMSTLVEKAVNLPALEKAQKNIAALKGSESVSVMDSVTAASEGRRRWISATVTTYAPPSDRERMANEIAAIILRDVPEAASRDRIVVRLVHGYDFLFSQSHFTNNWDYTPLEWRARLAKPQSPPR